MSARSERRLPATAGDFAGPLDSSFADLAVGVALPPPAGSAGEIGDGSRWLIEARA
jgi:hypothetical protein